jgi:hypothetical protein
LVEAEIVDAQHCDIDIRIERHNRCGALLIDLRQLDLCLVLACDYMCVGDDETVARYPPRPRHQKAARRTGDAHDALSSLLDVAIGDCRLRSCVGVDVWAVHRLQRVVPCDEPEQRP